MVRRTHKDGISGSGALRVLGLGASGFRASGLRSFGG